uniref:Uncharacterized protein n=1 Tax=Anguilla anguilla TaxID=7936 RepID=A0A0E9U415_ANGAN
MTDIMVSDFGRLAGILFSPCNPFVGCM